MTAPDANAIIPHHTRPWPIGMLGTASGDVTFSVKDGCVIISGDQPIILRHGDADHFVRLLFRAIDKAEEDP